MADALPFGVASPQEDEVPAAPLVGHLAAGVLNIPKRLIDATAQAVPGLRKEDVTDNPNAEEPNQPMYNAAWDTARALQGAGAPAAETNAAGIFGGRLAKTADHYNMNDAENMIHQGYLPDEVLSSTGWSRNPIDRQMRFEIPDNKMSLRYMPTGEGDMAQSTVGQLVNHPDLLNAYPHLKSLGMYLTKDSRFPTGTGAFTGKHLEVSAPNMDVARSVAAHELQHGVQGLENFAYGDNPSGIANMIEKGLRKNPNLLGGNKFMDVVNEAYPIYKNMAGEVEARNVQERLGMSPSQRLLKGPWYTQDTPYQEQFIHGPNQEILRALKQR
jgi:hypothetical protein